MSTETKRVETTEATDETDLPVLPFVEAPPAPEHMNALLYGPPGSGKSTAAATAPGPIMWLNAEGGNALAYARKIAAQRGTRILEVRIDPRERSGLSVKQVLDEAYLHVKNGREPQVQTVVVDTLAKVREGLIAQMVVPGAKNSIQQFGDVAKALGGFVKAMRDLPVNLILLAHEDVSDDAETGRIVRPLIGGVLTETIPGEVDVMAYCAAHREENAVTYMGQLVEGRARRAKDRSGGLGTVRPLDMTEWLHAFREALGTGEDLPWADELPEVSEEQAA